MNTSWRYCISRELEDGVLVFGIREVYTDSDGTIAWSESTVEPQGETLTEIVADLGHMESATVGDVLDLTLDPPRLVPKRDVA